MTSDEVGALVAVIGLLSQSGGALLLVCLFAALLRSHPRPQPYFRQWTRAWVALVVALAGVGVQYAFPQLMAAQPLAPRAANLVYQAGKLLFVSFLLAGTLNYARGSRPRVFLRWAVPAALAYALVSAVFSGPFLNAVMVFQTPLVVGPFLACAWLLLRLPGSRGTLGSRTTGIVFVTIAALWVLYALAFAFEGSRRGALRTAPSTSSSGTTASSTSSSRCCWGTGWSCSSWRTWGARTRTRGASSPWRTTA